MKKFLNIFFFVFIGLFSSAYKRPDVYVIDAEKNAFIHNNLALQYIEEQSYAAAIAELNIAIKLNPNTQATAVYYNNLGEVYMKLGMYQTAQACFEKSIYQYSLNFVYYQNLAKCYKAQNQINKQIKAYSANSKNPLNMIMLGLLYIENGDRKSGIIKLDEFCMQEPQLIITSAVKNYIKSTVTEK